jgi:hypothetical protein
LPSVIAHAIQILEQVKDNHQYDQNFPTVVMTKIKEFLSLTDLETNPAHESLIHEMKVEAILCTENSPYAEVRALVENYDDPDLPVTTLRAYIIGTLFVFGTAFVNMLFINRQPSIGISPNVTQLLSFPIGKACERFLPDVGFTMFGRRVSLNPGPFNRKEHMLITIMASVGYHTPYTNNIIISQYLPM